MVRSKSSVASRRRFPPRTSECQFRVGVGRCVFVDGHPGAHVCVGAHSARVAIRGAGEIPEETYVVAIPEEAERLLRAADPDRAREAAVWAGWSGPMVRRLLSEIREAGVAPPHDWVANFRRLRNSGGGASAAPASGTTGA
jgi:hypothetical protein